MLFDLVLKEISEVRLCQFGPIHHNFNIKLPFVYLSENTKVEVANIFLHYDIVHLQSYYFYFYFVYPISNHEC